MESTPTFSNTICWADDDKDDLEIFSGVIKDIAPHHQVLEFTNGRELLGVSQQHTSRRLPLLGSFGPEYARDEWKRNFRVIEKESQMMHIPVVVFSTASNFTDRAFCEQMQAGFITKPTTYQEVKVKVKNIVALCEDEKA